MHGKFSADGKEYMITDPRTPKPWVNYLTNGRYCTFMSHTGGGYTFWKDPFVNGITRWGPRLKGAALGREVYIRTEFNGLKIDPCIPGDWASYKIKRRFRNAIYDITVNNPEGVQYGVREIRIDGEKYESNILPIYADGRIHRVEVTLGEK